MSKSNNEASFFFWADRGGKIGSDIVPDGAQERIAPVSKVQTA